MDFSWSDEQLAFKRSVAEFAQKELNHGLVERDRMGSFPARTGKSVPTLAF